MHSRRRHSRPSAPPRAHLRSYTTARNMGIFAEAIDNDRDLAVILYCVQAAKLREAVRALPEEMQVNNGADFIALVSSKEKQQKPLLQQWLSHADNSNLLGAATNTMVNVMAHVRDFAKARLDAPLQCGGRCVNPLYQGRPVVIMRGDGPCGGQIRAPDAHSVVSHQSLIQAPLISERQSLRHDSAAISGAPTKSDLDKLAREAQEAFNRIPEAHRDEAGFVSAKEKFLSPDRAASLYFIPTAHADVVSQALKEVAGCAGGTRELANVIINGALAAANKADVVIPENSNLKLLQCWKNVYIAQVAGKWASRRKEIRNVLIFGAMDAPDSSDTTAANVMVIYKGGAKKVAEYDAYRILEEGAEYNLKQGKKAPAGHVFMGSGIAPCFVLAKNNQPLAVDVADSCGSNRLVDLQCMCAAVSGPSKTVSVIRLDVPVTWQQPTRKPPLVSEGGNLLDVKLDARPPALENNDLVQALLQRAGNCGGASEDDIYDIMLVDDGSNASILRAALPVAAPPGIKRAVKKGHKEKEAAKKISVFSTLTAGPPQFDNGDRNKKSNWWSWLRSGGKGNRAQISSYDLFAVESEFNAKLGYRCGADCAPPVDLDTTAYATEGTKKQRGAGKVASRKLWVVTCKNLAGVLKEATLAPQAEPSRLIKETDDHSNREDRLREVTAYATWLAGGGASNKPLAALQPIQHVQFAVLERDKGAAAWAGDIKKMLDLGFELLTGTARPRQPPGRGCCPG